MEILYCHTYVRVYAKYAVGNKEKDARRFLSIDVQISSLPNIRLTARSQLTSRKTLEKKTNQ